MEPKPNNWALRSMVMFGISLFLCLSSGFLLIGSQNSGMFGPSPAAALFILCLVVAAIFNIAGIGYGSKVEQKDMRQWCTLLNSILPLILCLLFFFSQVSRM